MAALGPSATAVGDELTRQPLRLYNQKMGCISVYKKENTEPPSTSCVLQAFLPNLVAILQRGKDNAAIFQVLEGYFVTAEPGLVNMMLEGWQMPQIVTSLQRSLDAVLVAAQKAQTSTPFNPGVPTAALSLTLLPAQLLRCSLTCSFTGLLTHPPTHPPSHQFEHRLDSLRHNVKCHCVTFDFKASSVQSSMPVHLMPC